MLDERVAALDVFGEIGKDFGAFEGKLRGRCAGFGSEEFQEERKLRHFHRLRVDIDAINIVQQNLLLLPERERKDTLFEFGALCFARFVGMVVIPMLHMVQHSIVDGDKERSGASGNVCKTEFGDFLWSKRCIRVVILIRVVSGDPARLSAGVGGHHAFVIQDFSDGILDNIIDNILRRVIHSARLADFRLLFEFRTLGRGADHFA